MKEAYLTSVENILKELETSNQGLSQAEVKSRQLRYGYNEIKTTKKVSLFKLFLDQIINPIVLMLLGAVTISFFTGKYFEAGLIAGIIFFMSIIGVFLENKANNAVNQLKSLVKEDSSVIRNGKIIRIASKELVPGDILFLSEGDKVSADARIIEVNSATVDESILTGESVPISKNTDALSTKVIIADQKNMIFSGTFVTQGNLKAVVVSTGENTELGKITKKLSEIEAAQTPLQEQLEHLSKILSISTLALCSIILLLSIIRGENLTDALTQSLSLAIAFIPEGLTAVMTVVLALGVKEMVKKNVIVKKLLAAEGLGSINILATDKTGTITTGIMSVEKLWMFDKDIDINEFQPTSEIEHKVLDVIKFCNNHKGSTEAALTQFLSKFGTEFELTERSKEFVFSSKLKRMSVIHENNGTTNLFSKGAPDVLAPLCKYYFDEKQDGLVEISDAELAAILNRADSLARDGYRVLCFAYRDIPKDVKDLDNREDIEKDLVFVGLIGLMDPLREEVKETVSTLKDASIRAIMITGDHPEIARTIAINSGIADDENALVIKGVELEEFINGEGNLTKEQILNCNIFARVTPEHKEILVDIYKDSGSLIAMAGDGLNDVVAISKANIGIGVVNAMDVVKESADVIITGSYNALANAVEMGRLVMFRTRLYLHYLLSGNMCQVGVFVLALGFNQPFPLTAIQLLIINLLTDAAPAMAMAFEKSGKNIMKQPPKPQSELIINRYIWKSIFIQSIASSIFLFAVFYLTLPKGLAFAQTATFTAYLAQKLLRAFTARSFTESIFSYGIFSNIATLLSVILGVVVWGLIVVVYPETFQMESIDIKTMAIIGLFALIMPILEEVLKKLNR